MNYRYSFNGKEKDDEAFEGCLAFEARIFDGRLGRFLSLDPRMAEYAWQTPYAYFKNCPVSVLDIAGMGGPYQEDVHTPASDATSILPPVPNFQQAENIESQVNTPSTIGQDFVPEADRDAALFNNGVATYPTAFIGPLPQNAVRDNGHYKESNGSETFSKMGCLPHNHDGPITVQWATQTLRISWRMYFNATRERWQILMTAVTKTSALGADGADWKGMNAWASSTPVINGAEYSDHKLFFSATPQPSGSIVEDGFTYLGSVTYTLPQMDHYETLSFRIESSYCVYSNNGGACPLVHPSNPLLQSIINGDLILW